MKSRDSVRPSARLYRLVAIGLTAIASILGVLALFLNYDSLIGYYSNGAIFSIALAVVCVASVVFFAVFAIFRFRGLPSAYAKKTSLAVRIAAFASAALALLLAITDLRSGASLLALLLGLGTCLYFLLMATEKATPALSLAFGFCTILRLVVEVARSYTDFLLPMNSPEKLWLHLAAVAGIFFLISEMRAMIAKPYTATTLFASATAMLLGTTSALTLLLGNLTHRFYGTATKGSTVFAALLLAFSIYAGTRLFTIVLCPTEEEPEKITEPEVTEEVTESEETEQQ